MGPSTVTGATPRVERSDDEMAVRSADDVQHSSPAQVLPAHGLTELPVRCRDCATSHVLALPADSDVAKELLYTRCPSCRLFAVLEESKVSL